MVVDAVIFDFDDTLVATNEVFEQAKENFLAAMQQLGFSDREALVSYLQEADIRRVLAAGYMAQECYPLAMRETYQHFCELMGKETNAAAAASIEEIGWQVYELEAQLMPGAKQVLAALQDKVRLFLLTQGDESIQLKRVQKSGLGGYFRKITVVPNKDVAAYQRFVAEQQIDVSRSWMIGNSFRSDINPALSVGLAAAHYKIAAWDFEYESAIGPHQSLTKLSDFLQVLELE